MKGIVLAGGKGTRLYPITLATSKQLTPIYDKPLIYYPISTLMLAGIQDILIISTPKDLPKFKNLLGSGERFGIKFSYKEQPNPDGLAQAFILAKDFLKGQPGCLILGDNVFFGDRLPKLIKKAIKTVENQNKANIFAYHVKDPQKFGVVEFDKKGNVIGIEEKPEVPKSNYASIGLYLYPKDVTKKVKKLKPSNRGELEITDLSNLYLKEGRLKVTLLGRGYAWFDTGTPESLNEAANFVKTIQNQQNVMIACLEEIAYLKKYITKSKLLKLAKPLKKTSYGKYLMRLANELI